MNLIPDGPENHPPSDSNPDEQQPSDEFTPDAPADGSTPDQQQTLETLTDVVILIPSHSLEDFPTELDEDEAASLLNAFAVAWHPRLLATTGVIPNWQRADEPTDPTAGQLFLIPTASTDWLGHDWATRAREAGCGVITDLSDRDEMVAAALSLLGEDREATPLDPDLTADFLALGSCYLQMELLTRHMHHFGNLDEVFLQREAVMAAESVIAEDPETARTHLKSCFESLHEARERFYPVDCYLIDLCLIVPEVADEHFRKLLVGELPVNLLLRAADAVTIVEEHPELAGLIREAWERETIDVVGGDHEEIPVPLVPLDSLLWDLQRGRRTLKQLFGREPTTWARRRFGLANLLPQLLSRSGYHSALHFLLDDGLYPDSEQSKLRWEGCDGTVLDAMSRIPLAAEGATSFLRFPMRMAESMEEDQSAALMLARWPEIVSPWYEDLVRMHAYAPCLGRFVTLDDYFQNTDTPGRISSYNASEYLAPFLTQSVAGQDPDPVSRHLDHFSRRGRFDAAAWCDSLSQLLAGVRLDADGQADLESLVETAGCEGDEEDRERADSAVETFTEEATGRLAGLITGASAATGETGQLIVNTLSFPRTVAVGLPDGHAAPADTPGLRGIQDTANGRQAIIDLPASGYTWLPSSPGPAETADENAALADELLLRNEFFEVHISPQTGGIERIKGYGRQPNVLSQQLAFRFPRERTVPTGDDDDESQETSTWYSEMVGHGVEILSAGPHVGEIRTHGEIIDQLSGTRIAGFRQTFRTLRYRPSVEVEIELELDQLPEGDPWSNYLSARFAYGDATAAITRSVLGSAQPAGNDRFESPYYVEIANESNRVTLVAPGMPFYRKTGDRMIDAILVPEGEQRRKFSMTITVDQAYPMQEALDHLVPPVVRHGVPGPPAAGGQGWFFHLDSRNVQITRVLDLADLPSWTPDETVDDPIDDGYGDLDGSGQPETDPNEQDQWSEYDQPTLPDGFGFAVRLQETEGRHRSTTLRCWRTPIMARQRDFEGRTLAELPIEGDGVRVDLTAHEIADIELRFD
ncbi:MAG TPA: hypothetical protein DER64_09420 [Planctomycetaceae bacterium]|nr:hypothetical protein [Planctomycetaceae bacterium]